jgi:hypothetical protein
MADCLLPVTARKQAHSGLQTRAFLSPQSGSYAFLVMTAQYSVGDPSMSLDHLPLLARQTHALHSQLVHTGHGQAEAMPVSRGRAGPWPRVGPTTPGSASLRPPAASWPWAHAASGTAQRGQHAAGAVLASWKHTSSGSTITSVRCTARVGGSRCVINGWSAWS